MDPNSTLAKIKLTDVQEKQKQQVLEKVLKEGLTIKEAMNCDPQVFEWIYSIAYRYYQSGKVDEALPIFSFLVKVDTKDPRFPLGMAACYEMKKEYRRAIESYMHLFYFSDPSDPMPWYRIAECYLKLEEKEAAMIALATFILLAGNEEKFSSTKQKAARMLTHLTCEVQKALNKAAEEAKIS